MLLRLALLAPAALIGIQSAFAGGSGIGQEQPPAVITPRRKPHVTISHRPGNLRLDVKVVLVPVTVIDALNRPITTLSKEGFRVLEDGVEQKITSLVQEQSPLSLGLLFDSSGSMTNRIDGSLQALRNFFDTIVPGDEFFVVQFSDEATLLSGFTPQPKEIFKRLGSVQASGWTALLDAVALSTSQMRFARNRNKALLILSDGNDNNSRFSASEIRNMVMESDFRVYAIGLFHRPHLLQRLAHETGGRVAIAQSMSELPDVVQRLSAEIRSEYLLGYTPTNARNDGKYRKVKVELVQSHGAQPLRASWRHGYYALGE
jgi:Ca-activated chloride channel family protein